MFFPILDRCMSLKPFLYFHQVAVFAGGVDTTATETKGTVLIHSAEQVSFSPVISMGK